MLERAETEPMIDLRRYADREHLLLASYAMHSRDTEGGPTPSRRTPIAVRLRAIAIGSCTAARFGG